MKDGEGDKEDTEDFNNTEKSDSTDVSETTEPGIDYLRANCNRLNERRATDFSQVSASGSFDMKQKCRLETVSPLKL